MDAYLQETAGQLRRWLLHLRREPFNLAFSLLQPLIFLVFFGGAFENVVRGELAAHGYRAYILGGVLTLTFFGNSMAGGIALLFDKESGFLARSLVAPIGRSSLLVSRFLAVNLVSAVQAVLVLALGRVLGVRVASGLPGTLLLFVLGWLLGFGLTVLSLSLAFKLTGHGDFFALLGTVTLPLTFLSTAFVPLERMPGWMQALARLNPLSYCVDGMRALVLEPVIDGRLLLRQGAALLVFDALLLALGVRVLRRSLG